MVGLEIQNLYLMFDSLASSAGAQTAIARVDLAGTAASARLDSENVAAQSFTDFFNLLKYDSSWIIVIKVNHIYPAT